MDIQNLVAIDVHTHAEVSERIPDDPLWKAMQEADVRQKEERVERHVRGVYTATRHVALIHAHHGLPGLGFWRHRMHSD